MLEPNSDYPQGRRPYHHYICRFGDSYGNCREQERYLFSLPYDRHGTAQQYALQINDSSPAFWSVLQQQLAPMKSPKGEIHVMTVQRLDQVLSRFNKPLADSSRLLESQRVHYSVAPSTKHKSNSLKCANSRDD